MRHVIHTVLSILMWCLFGYYWWVVSRQQLNPSTIDALQMLAGLIVAGLLLTVGWVVHNVRLARRFGRRKGFPAPPEEFTADHLERPLVSPGLDALRTERLVTVSLDDEGRKVYAARPVEDA
jgi:hypothetical protein